MLSAAATSIDPRAFRTTMGRFATGVTVISTLVDGQVHAMTANAFLSVSLEPPMVLISIGRRARMHTLLKTGDWFGVSVLAADQESLSNHFAGRSQVEAPIRWQWAGDVPLLAGAIAHVSAQVVAQHPAGDHSLFIGQVDHLDQQPGSPLVFHAGAYSFIA